jgi:transcriptional regulator with GAF, ATPase, and Fis domain
MRVERPVVEVPAVHPPQVRPALSFPKRATVAELRRLRDKHFRDGHHELALQIATDVARRDPGRESFLRQGVLFQQVGRYREALEVLRDALRFETGPAYLVADIHLHVAYTWFLMDRRKRVGEAVRRANSLRLKPRTAYNYHIMCGNFLLSKRDFRGAQREYIDAEKCATSAIARGRAAINQGVALIRRWDFGAAQIALDRALRILKKANHAAELAIARCARAAIHLELGQPRRAMGMFAHAGRTFRRLGKMDREAEVLGLAGYAAVVAGAWPKAKAFIDRAITMASATGQHLVLSCAYANRALVHAQYEDLDEAQANLMQCQRILRGKRDWLGTLHMCRAQARIAGRVGKWDEVFRVSRRAERLAGKVGDALRVVEFRKMRAQAEEHLGRKKASSYARNSAGRLEVLLKKPKESEFEKLLVKLADSEVPVLILGGEGTRKAEFAKEIHRKSSRAERPCVVVPCEHLSFPASDLYGHAEGAWSGASRPAQGYVAGAQGGTIVLDCIDQMPREDQHVLMPLFDHKTRAVGGTEERILNVRVMATCTTLDTVIPELRARLEGALLRVPSLQDEKTLIPRQVEQLLAGRRVITPDAVAELARHPWEGNVAELQATMDRMVMLSGRRIGRKLVRQVLADAVRRARQTRLLKSTAAPKVLSVVGTK